MVKAYVFINTSSKNITEVAEAFRELPGVKESYAVLGNYDIVLIVESESARSLRALITESIRKVGNVDKTITMVALDD